MAGKLSTAPDLGLCMAKVIQTQARQQFGGTKGVAAPISIDELSTMLRRRPDNGIAFRCRSVDELVNGFQWNPELATAVNLALSGKLWESAPGDTTTLAEILMDIEASWKAYLPLSVAEPLQNRTRQGVMARAKMLMHVLQVAVTPDIPWQFGMVGRWKPLGLPAVLGVRGAWLPLSDPGMVQKQLLKWAESPKTSAAYRGLLLEVEPVTHVPAAGRTARSFKRHGTEQWLTHPCKKHCHATPLRPTSMAAAAEGGGLTPSKRQGTEQGLGRPCKKHRHD